MFFNKKKIVAMIPARLGSKRVKMKNLRKINGKPLIEYIIEATILSGEFEREDIYLNSESEEFRKIADDWGIKFYKRPEFFASDAATNDHFMAEFLVHTECDAVVQLLPTSPFISPDQIKEFTKKFRYEKLDTLISVKNVQIECLYEGRPINFSSQEVTKPSQELKPIQAYACGLMAWKKMNYLTNYDNYQAAYHGGDGKIGTYVMTGYSTVDIDTEDDFMIAEVVAKALPPSDKIAYKKRYHFYNDGAPVNLEAITTHSEADVPSILAKDGVSVNDLFDANKEIVSIQGIIDSMPKDKSWSKRIVDTESNSMCLICQFPGEGNRMHYHSDWNEWWYIVQGEWIFEIEGEKKIVKKGDLVFIAKNRVHRIECTGTGPAIRMAVSRADVAHIYVEPPVDPTLFNRMMR